jgi:hypothetical protein
MGLLKCSKPMHTLFGCTLLHVQVSTGEVVVPLEVKKDSNPFSIFSEKLELGL